MSAMRERDQLLNSIHLWLAVFIGGLLFSGITAFPLVHETALLVRIDAAIHLSRYLPGLDNWILLVHDALVYESVHYPFLAYGTDWLAFGHLVIATAFVGAWKDPVRNRWLITWGLIACAAVVPLAFICGPLRGIPLCWSFVDCSFGLFGCIPLFVIRKLIQELEAT